MYFFEAFSVTSDNYKTNERYRLCVRKLWAFSKTIMAIFIAIGSDLFCLLLNVSRLMFHNFFRKIVYGSTNYYNKILFINVFQWSIYDYLLMLLLLYYYILLLPLLLITIALKNILHLYVSTAFVPAKSRKLNLWLYSLHSCPSVPQVYSWW